MNLDNIKLSFYKNQECYAETFVEQDSDLGTFLKQNFLNIDDYTDDELYQNLFNNFINFSKQHLDKNEIDKFIFIKGCFLPSQSTIKIIIDVSKCDSIFLNIFEEKLQRWEE